MGITGLLPCLKTHQQSKHLSALKGKTVGVDSYAWLHKGRLDGLIHVSVCVYCSCAYES